MSTDGGHDEVLAAYRSSIDSIDADLVLLLAKRFKITNEVGVYKATVGLPPEDPERERVQFTRLRALAAQAGLDQLFIEKFLRCVISEVTRQHYLIRADSIDDSADTD